MDVKYHIICDVIDEGLVHLAFVRSCEQRADTLAKALDVKTFEKHAKFVLDSS